MSNMHTPPHPGEILADVCLEPLKLSITDTAEALGVSRKTLSALLNGRQGVSPEMALRIAAAFGGSAEHWLRLQDAYDLWWARQNIDLSGIKKLRAA
jgi:addiction module HigA family antidote